MSLASHTDVEGRFQFTNVPGLSQPKPLFTNPSKLHSQPYSRYEKQHDF